MRESGEFQERQGSGREIGGEGLSKCERVPIERRKEVEVTGKRRR